MIKVFISALTLVTLFSACSRSSLLTGISDTEWRVTSIYAKEIKANNNTDFPKINFGSNNKLFGSTGCNKFIGSYKLDKNSISLEPGAVTKMFCPDSPEQDFLSAIRKVSSFKFEGETLKLLNGSNTLMTLVPTEK